MESIRYELKYCEGCGTLKLHPVTSVTSNCRICEDLLSRFRFPVRARTKAVSGLARAAAQIAVTGSPLTESAIPAGRAQ